MGFESSYAAQRRLAVLATRNEFGEDALPPSLFAGQPCEGAGGDLEPYSQPGLTCDAVQHLEDLAHDIVATPGAGGALLVAFAAQSRALSLVLEAVLRTPGVSSLPADVMSAVRSALSAPAALPGLELAWRR